MKIFPPLVQAVQTALQKILLEGRVADRALEGLFKSQRKLGSRDRKFVAESVYECVRWTRRLKATAEHAGVHRPQYCDELLVYGFEQGWNDWAGLSTEEIQKLKTAATAQAQWPRAVRESINDEIDAAAASELGAAWDQELHALNEQAPVDLRVNRHRIALGELRRKLQDEGIATEELAGFADALTLRERKNVFSIPIFKEGFFEVQDRSSQRVAPFAKPEGAARIIDACAGAGGKTLHLASLMKNRGKIISLDIFDWKLKELEVRARRGRFSNIETRLIDSAKVIKRLDQSADRVLLDVPCSGLGVIRRNPDAKMRLEAAELERLRILQAEILGSYSRMVKVGGYLVYATCSVLPSENLRQVENFLQSQGAHWDLEEHWSALPSERNGDGFFAARLKRKSAAGL